MKQQQEYHQDYEPMEQEDELDSSGFLNQQNFQIFFKQVADEVVDFNYVKEFYNTGFQELPTNQEISEIQEGLFSKRHASALKRNWTKAEILCLVWCACKYAKHNDINIKSLQDQDFYNISQFLYRREWQGVKQKWLSLRKQRLQNHPFTLEEDNLIVALYQQFKNQQNKWTLIADEINRQKSSYRTSRQFRDRYLNHLNPELLNIGKAWDEQQDYQLILLVKEKGFKWAEISKILLRSEFQIKNRYHSLLKREGLTQNDLDQLLDKLLWRLEKEPFQNFTQSNTLIQALGTQGFILQPSQYFDFQSLTFELDNLQACLVDMTQKKVYLCTSEQVLEVIQKKQKQMSMVLDNSFHDNYSHIPFQFSNQTKKEFNFIIESQEENFNGIRQSKYRHASDFILFVKRNSINFVRRSLPLDIFQ
ncbi:hypothetical protein pb186bvf_003833 [Paramecium bursaria]